MSFFPGLHKAKPALIPDGSNWTIPSSTIPGTGNFHGSLFSTDTDLYICGGSDGGTHDAIWKASRATPTVWVVTGSTLPVGSRNAYHYQVGGNAYIVAGYDGASTETTQILTASMSDLESWSVSGDTFPVAQFNGGGASQSLAVGSDKIWIWGGRVGGTGNSNIYSATHAAPTVWTDTGFNHPTAGNGSYDAGSYRVYDKIYSIGGIDAPTDTWVADITDLTSWSAGTPFPEGSRGTRIAVIGEYIYTVGALIYSSAADDRIYRAHVSDPTNFELQVGNISPALTAGGLAGQLYWGTDGRTYVMHGLNMERSDVLAGTKTKLKIDGRNFEALWTSGGLGVLASTDSGVNESQRIGMPAHFTDLIGTE